MCIRLSFYLFLFLSILSPDSHLVLGAENTNAQVTLNGMNAADLLKRADQARGGVAQGLAWKVKVSSVENGSTTENSYDVKVKGVDVLARCTAPARQKGETFLFNDRNLWIHKLGMRKPVSISPRQRLVGQAANGDIAITNYARDYDGTIVGEESVDGVPSYRLKLQARSKSVTYDQITYWISKDRMLGLRAEFLTQEGQVFKRANFEYKNSIAVGAKQIPFVSRMVIVDAAYPTHQTTLIYDHPQAEPIDESIFNVNNLSR